MNTTTQIDTLQQFGHSFQTKVIAALLTDSKFLDSLSDIIHIKFFESEANKWIVGEIIDYQLQYKKSPSMDVFKVQSAKIDNEILKKTVVDQLRHVYMSVGNLDMDYIKDQFSNFCINQNLKEVILKSVDLLKVGSYDRIKELTDNALKVGTTVDLGHNYTEDYTERYDEDKRTTIGTNWDVINDLMGGGLGPGELGVVVAPSGVGKTWILTAIGAAAVKQGLTVAHYSMELSEFYVGARYDTVFTGIPTKEHAARRNDLEHTIRSLPGKLFIKYFPPKGVSSKKLGQHIEKMTAA
jgi:replicative DNA helicase